MEQREEKEGRNGGRARAREWLLHFSFVPTRGTVKKFFFQGQKTHSHTTYQQTNERDKHTFFFFFFPSPQEWPAIHSLVLDRSSVSGHDFHFSLFANHPRPKPLLKLCHKSLQLLLLAFVFPSDHLSHRVAMCAGLSPFSVFPCPSPCIDTA